MSGGRGTVVLVGAGLGGSLLAILMGRAGYTVRGFEMRRDPRRGPVAGGRSINLALSARGLHALEAVGLKDKVLAAGVPMRGRMIHDLAGRTAFQPYGTEEAHANHSVSRADLNVILIEAAEEHPNVRFAFEQRCTGIDAETVTATFEGGGNATGDVILGADGAFSAVRRALMRTDRFDFSQSYLSHGYKELTIPPAAGGTAPGGAATRGGGAARDGGTFQMEKNALHIWPRGGFMMIALPNRDGSFTCTLFWPFEGENSFTALRTPADINRFFAREFPDAVPLMPDLAQQYAANPVGLLVTLRCRPWHDCGRVGILGDAAHAVVPFHGQGANCAFEDCIVLDECARQHGPDWNAVLTAFESRRKEHADALADLSLANFVEMRDHTASRLFRMRKALEKILYRLFPATFMPLYMMISFSRIPYADTVRLARRQSRLLRAAAGVAGALLFLFFIWLIRGG